jgi:hypothetical protein
MRSVEKTILNPCPKEMRLGWGEGYGGEGLIGDGVSIGGWLRYASRALDRGGGDNV